MFVAGDYGIQQVPRHFKASEILVSLRASFEGLTTEMKELVQNDVSAFQKGKKHQCRVCTRQFSKAFVRCEVCWLCEDSFRSEQKCPFEKGHPVSVCPHSRRCFSCEGASCEECKLVQGDGGSVPRMIEALQPQIIFIDFDRTLCSTRSGCQPVIGKHGINPGLFSVLVSHPCVHILTRQNFTHEPILRRFLAARTIHNINLHCLGGTKITKSNVIATLLTSGSLGLMVDDTLQELVSIKQSNLVRVRFHDTDFSMGVKQIEDNKD